MNLVQAAVVAAVYPGQQDHYVNIESIYADRVVISKDGRLCSYLYTLNEANQVELGQAEEVIVDHQPVVGRESLRIGPLTDSDSVFIEALDNSGQDIGQNSSQDIGLKYQVRIIRAGVSKNRNYYPDAALREAAPKSPSHCVAVGPARILLKSSTLIPSRLFEPLLETSLPPMTMHSR